MAVDVGSAKGYLDLDISGFLSGLREAQTQASTTSSKLNKIGDSVTKVGKGITSAGTTLTKYVTVPLLGVGAAGLKVATDFEKGMSEVKAISGATGKDFDALKDKAIELGASTAFSAGEVAEAMTEMAKAGWDSQQIIDGMSGVLDAAAASGEGLATVSTIVADTITGFGMAAADSTKVADLLTQAANSGTIGITDLGESFKYIAPVASSMGLSVEDVTTAISAMSMAGIKGSQAGTSLRTMLTRMVKPTDAVAKAMDELNLELTNSDGSFKSLDEIVAMMRGSFEGLTDEQKTYYATVLAGQEGMSGMLSLLNLTEEEYNAIAESMENSGGVAKETAAIMQDNLQSKVEQLLGSLESLAIKLADFVIPGIQRLVEWLTSLVEKFTALDPETQKTILKFAGIAAAAGPVLLAVGKLVTGVGGLISAFGSISKIGTTMAPILAKLGISFGAAGTAAAGAGTAAAGAGSSVAGAGAAAGAAATPIGWIIAAIVALIAVFVTLWKNNEEFRDKIKEIWGSIVEMFKGFFDGITENVNKLGFDFENFGEVLKALWTGITELIGPHIIGAFQGLADTFKFFLDTILATVSFFVSILTGDWEGAWQAVKDFFFAHVTFIVDFWKNVAGILTGTLDAICGWFGTTWEDTWNSIKEFFVNIWDGIVTWFQNTLNAIGTFFADIWNGISTFFSGVWETIKNVVTVGVMFIVELIKAWFNLVTLPFRFIWENCKDTIISVWESIKTAVSTALNAISTFISNIWNSIKAFLQPILTAIANFISTVWNNIKTAVSNVVNAISTTVSNVFNSVKTTVSNIFNSIKSTATNIWNNIKDAISGPINTAKTTISNVINSIKTIFTNGFNAAKTTVTSVFNSIKTTISNILNTAKTTVQNAINKIKGMFNFSWSFPKLKMPHFTVTGKFSLNPPSVPKLSISWYKKAMSGGMILNSPTIFGYDSESGQFLGGGEAGSETVVGTASLMNMIRQAVKDVIGPIINVTYQLAKASTELGYITYNGFTKQAQVFEKAVASGVMGSNGDTFNFYSPKAIDEIEAAKQMKKAKRDLAEGF